MVMIYDRFSRPMFGLKNAFNLSPLSVQRLKQLLLLIRAGDYNNC